MSETIRVIVTKYALSGPLRWLEVEKLRDGVSNTGKRRSFKFRRATVEHVVPRSAGGSNDWSNLVAACLWCNNYRANQPIETALAKIARRLRRQSHPHQQFERTGWWPSANNGLQSLSFTPTPEGGSSALSPAAEGGE